jgi:23S rRNA (cytosine1962-C5)-methyltransferase
LWAYRNEFAGLPGQGEAPDKPQPSDGSGRLDRSDRSDKSDQSDRSDESDRSDRSNRSYGTNGFAPHLENGCLVDVFSDNGKLVGRGFYQAEGGIAVRILDRAARPINAAFLRERVTQALSHRKKFFPGSRVYRWVHAESDGLPGLVADRFDSLVSIKTSCAFYERMADALMEVFLRQDGVEGVLFEYGDTVRRLGQTPAELEVLLDGVRLGFSLSQGQKTGLFLDQRENCRLLDAIAAGARVLDAHCYVGLWSCRALRAGAASVLGVDSSARAVERAERNAALNGGADKSRFECVPIEKVFARGERYDVVCLDPPALAKTRAHLGKALELYQALNRDGMKSVSPGGYLITSSCSQPVDTAAFLEMLKRAARSAQRQTALLALRGAPPDHPVLMEMPETAYLKCALLRVW